MPKQHLLSRGMARSSRPGSAYQQQHKSAKQHAKQPSPPGEAVVHRQHICPTSVWSATSCLQENLPLDSPSGRRAPRAPSLHTHSLRLAKADSGLTMSSYQTKMRQQYQQSASDLLCRSLQRGSVCCA